MSNLGNFNRDIRRDEQRIIAEATEAIRSVGQEAYSSLVEAAHESGDGGSPVASGRYAASMRLELNKLDTSVAPRDPSYRYPSPDVHKYNVANLPARTRRNVPASRIAAKLRTFKLGDTIFISNSVPYSVAVEDRGHSWQTPDGVFERTFRALNKRFKNIRLRVGRA